MPACNNATKTGRLPASYKTKTKLSHFAARELPLPGGCGGIGTAEGDQTSTAEGFVVSNIQSGGIDGKRRKPWLVTDGCAKVLRYRRRTGRNLSSDIV
jgi:hypothetical protein